jgi:alkanesulfonate monooxygenase SsuD/methylene tetrahydromethanopterin reductase-like flavin-dependent oxidoreductase (luciferase family)
MGTGGTNIYTNALTRPGHRDEARAAVPLDLGRLTSLLGSTTEVAERIAAYRDSGITTLLAKIDGDHTHQLHTIGRLLEAVPLSV